MTDTANPAAFCSSAVGLGFHLAADDARAPPDMALLRSQVACITPLRFPRLAPPRCVAPLSPTTPTMAAPSVQEYLDTHGMQQTVEAVLNSCVKAKPEEPLSFMVR